VERPLSAALVGIALLGALIFIAQRRTQPSLDERDRVAGEVDLAIRETAAGVKARADTLAQIPRLAWAVATDAATAADLTTEELAFRTQPDERIEIAQLWKDGRVRPLLRLPTADAAPLPVTRPGTHLVVADGQVLVVTVVGVTPAQRSDELRGALAVAQPLDTAALARNLDARGVGARLQIEREAIPLGARAPAGDQATVKVALATPSVEEVSLAVPGGGRTSGVLIPLLMLALAVTSASLLWRLARRAPARASTRTPVPDTIHDRAASQLSTARDDLETGGRASSRPTPIALSPLDPNARRELEETTNDRVGAELDPGSLMSGSVPLPEYPLGPGLAAADLPEDPGSEADPSVGEYRALFGEFIALRRTCGEPIENLNREQFVVALRRKRDQLIKERGVREVRFRLAFDNGKAAIRFVAPKRG
jgi:hypothetical protein